MRLVTGSSDAETGPGSKAANAASEAHPALDITRASLAIPLEQPVAISVFNVTVSFSPN